MNNANESLLQSALGGDAGALGALLHSCGREMRNRLHGQVGSAYRSAFDEEDVLQVTYLEAVLRLHQFRGSTIEAFLAWLTSVAHNNLRDAIKGLECDKRPAPRRRLANPLDEDGYSTVMDKLPASEPTPSRWAGRAEAKALIEAGLGRLPRDYERAIRLYDLDGQTIKDVAATMGRSPGAVHMLRQRGYDLLAELLGPAGNFFSGSW